jgi:hypothetical protein
MPKRWDDARSPTPAPAQPGDPYLRWAQATMWRGMKGQAGWDRNPADDECVQIIARADTAEVLKATMADPRFAVAPIYGREIPGTAHLARHFTAWVKRGDLDAGRIELAGLRWELSQPRRDAEKIARGSALGRFGPERDRIDFTASNVLADVIRGVPDRARDTASTEVIAAIDFGCPFLNPRYSRPGRPAETRLVAVWDQGSSVPPARDPRRRAGGWPWCYPDDFGFGRELPRSLLKAMVAAVQAPGSPIDELAAYRGIDYLIDYDDPRRRIWHATHGGHVLDVAGGATDPLTGEVDAAADARLIFVQLPSMTAGDSTGASLASHLLDGVRYVLARCDPQAKVLVNISYGSQAGPHDGSSLIESALDELLEQRARNFAITLSAGNSREKRCHVRRTVRVNRSALLRCAIAEGDTTDTFVEAWYTPPAADGWTLRARARAPNGDWSSWVAPPPDGEYACETLMRDPASQFDVVAMLRHDGPVPNGKPHLLLLAVAPTLQPAGLDVPTADAGEWEIELALQPDPLRTQAPPGLSVVVDARIERDDPGQNPGAGEHRFVDQDVDDDTDTLSSLATGTLTIAVGGFRLSDRRPTAYSAVGPQRGPGSPRPLVLAACEEDAVNPNIAATAVRSGEVFRMNGTSVAAPALARRLFNAMAARDISGRRWGEVLKRLAKVRAGFVRLPDPE